MSLDGRRSGWLERAKTGPLATFITPDLLELGDDPASLRRGARSAVAAIHRLQDAPDYRATLQAWFGLVEVGGRLIIVTPHAFLYERQLSLPSRWDPGQRRLYTPGSLMQEVEEALAPNSYRVRHLGDGDRGYDYGADPDEPPVGESEVVLVLEKIAPPDWRPRLAVEPPAPRPLRAAPDYAFEPSRTRVEVAGLPDVRRVLLLKLDHLGDFIMGLGALERARRIFRDAEITLVVGSWNLEMARDLGLADRIVAFDVFPRNSSEEEVDVAGKAGLFQQAVTGEYDLAIDLRAEHDTRFLLRLVKARLRAGVGARTQFPFLDIFLPVDITRGEPEAAKEVLFAPQDFPCQGSAERSPHRIVSRPGRVERDCAIVWGPYRKLRAGRYIFEPHFDVGLGEGVVMIDVALDNVRTAQAYVRDSSPVRLAFTVEEAQAEVEFRIWAVDQEPTIEISFYGGRLIREGAASVLHESEYASLLLELVTMRLSRTGVLGPLEGA